MHNYSSSTYTIVPGNTDTGNHCVWCDTLITLPFPFVLYDQTFNAVMVSSSGRLDFVCANDPANLRRPVCLRRRITAHLITRSSRYGKSGQPLPIRLVARIGQTGAASSPPFQALRRTASLTSNGTSCTVHDTETADFEVRLYENDPNQRFDVIYGSIRGPTDFDVQACKDPTGFFYPMTSAGSSAAERFQHLHHAYPAHANPHGDAGRNIIGHKHQ